MLRTQLLALYYYRRFLDFLKTALLYCHVLPVRLAVLLQSAVLAFLALEAVFSHAPYSSSDLLVESGVHCIVSIF